MKVNIEFCPDTSVQFTAGDSSIKVTEKRTYITTPMGVVWLSQPQWDCLMDAYSLALKQGEMAADLMRH